MEHFDLSLTLTLTLNLTQGSTWIGNRNGDAVQLVAGSDTALTDDTTTPFARSFYGAKGQY